MAKITAELKNNFIGIPYRNKQNNKQNIMKKLKVPIVALILVLAYASIAAFDLTGSYCNTTTAPISANCDLTVVSSPFDSGFKCTYAGVPCLTEVTTYSCAAAQILSSCGVCSGTTSTVVRNCETIVDEVNDMNQWTCDCQ